MIISDWLMPEMDGLELVRRIRARPSAHYIYTILVTVRAQKEDLVEAMEAGADDFITKPFDRDELRVRLREGERIIQLEQTLAEQNQRLLHVEQELTARLEGDSQPVHRESAAASARLPWERVQQSLSAIQAALPGLARIEAQLQLALSQVPPSSLELAESLRKLAHDCRGLRDSLDGQLTECQSHLRQCDAPVDLS
jgi:CheY-like chemotaxis protein